MKVLFMSVHFYEDSWSLGVCRCCKRGAEMQVSTCFALLGEKRQKKKLRKKDKDRKKERIFSCNNKSLFIIKY